MQVKKLEQVYDFEDIRPYRDAEVHTVLMQLTQEPKFMSLLPVLMPNIPTEQLLAKLQNTYEVESFQKDIVCKYVYDLEGKTTHGVNLEGLEKISKNKSYLYITNHRDIVLDSAFLNTGMVKEGYPFTEIAIGDNLLIYPWIKALVRLNRSFIVMRNVPVRQMLDISKRLSAYIRHTLVERNQSVWIAQREGRAKDSNDLTQEALLKMLNMSGEGDVVENAMQLNICPTAISYEYDPCDYLKAKEYQLKRDNPDFKKSPDDDLKNMETGITGFKGRVVYRFAGNICEEIRKIGIITDNKTEQYGMLAALIDKHIHQNYYIYANNKVAYDLLTGTGRFESEYTGKEKSTFETYLQMQLDKIDLPNKDEAFLRKKILEMYANPLINQMEATKKGI